MEVNRNELHVYSINENEHIGAINAYFDRGIHLKIPIVLLCYSSAVGDVAERLVKEVLPLVMSKVRYWGERVHLIDFGNQPDNKLFKKSSLSEFNRKAEGATNIGHVIEKLRLHFETYIKLACCAFDVLTIFAGEISDSENAELETKKLTDFLAKTQWGINSQAVRLITTSSNQQNTRALSYLLQINNSKEAKICDISATSSNDTIANEIAALFPEHMWVDFEKPIVSEFPSRRIEHQRLRVTIGWNVFWLTEVPTTITIDTYRSKFVNNVIIEGQLTLEKFQLLMELQWPKIVSHIKFLKIVGTTEANESVDKLFSYFAKTEEALAVQCSTPNNKFIANALAEIVTYKPNLRDSAEMLEFYRNPIKTIESQKEEERLKREKEQLRKQAEEERLKQAEDERLKREQEEHHQREEEAHKKRQEEELEKQAEEERLKREEDKRRQRKEEATAADNINTTNDPNSVQTVFILDEHSTGEHRHFVDKIVTPMLSKLFQEHLQLAHLVTFVRYKSTAAEMLHSLIRTLDATKQIRISVITNRDVQETDNLAKMVEEFLNGSGYSFEIQVVRLAAPSPKRYQVVNIDANESNEFIAEQIVAMSLQ